MKNSKLFYAAGFALTSVIATAQVNQTPVHTSGGQITLMKEKSQAATGSMFINEKYMPAKVSNLDNTVLVRYNAYADNFQVSDHIAGTEKILPQQAGVTITFTGTADVYTYEQYRNEKGEIQTGYLSLVSDNPSVKIFKRERIFLQPEVFPASSYQTYKPAAYKKLDDEFYIKIKDQNAEFFSSKKDLAKLVPSKSKEILDFIKKNKLDLEKEADLEQVGAYINNSL
ncbi:MAG: hypothetical protein DI539_07105 [Flavobacterium psychrophilum]|nr:MAG: hypothetical protein DI539_07105 [Flavobacterium psychrophilum]